MDLYVQYKREYILDRNKHWFHLGRCDDVYFIFLDVNTSFIIITENLSAVFAPFLWPKKCSSRPHLLLALLQHELTEPRRLRNAFLVCQQHCPSLTLISLHWFSNFSAHKDQLPSHISSYPPKSRFRFRFYLEPRNQVPHVISD